MFKIFHSDNQNNSGVEIENVESLLKLFKIKVNSDDNTFEHQNTRYKINLKSEKNHEKIEEESDHSLEFQLEKKNKKWRRNSTKEIAYDSDPCVKERPQTTGGRIFGTISEELHNEYKPKKNKLTNIDLPSACICREEIKKLERELTKKDEEILKLKKIIK